MIDDGRLPYFPCYPGKLLGALAAMSTDHKIVYMMVLLRIYDVRGPCPDSLDALSLRCGINKRRTTDALDALFRAGKLERVTGGIMNPFAAKVLIESEASRERLAKAGAEGGFATAKKYKKNQRNRPSDATATPQQQDLDLDSVGSNEPTTQATPAAVGGEVFEGDVVSLELDTRTRLFREGIPKLARITGKPVDRLKPIVGKWLRDHQDDAVAVLRAIEDAERNRVVEPVTWISASLRRKAPTPRRGGNAFARIALRGMEEMNGA